MRVKKILHRVGIAASVAMLGAATLFSPADAGAQDIKWKMTTFAQVPSIFHTNTMVPFVERVAEITEGKVQIEHVAAGVIAPPFQAYDAVIQGLAETANSTPLYAVNKDPANTFWAGHPGGMVPEQLFGWSYAAGGNDLLAEFRRAEMKLHAIPTSIIPDEMWIAHAPITKIEDLKGKKMRTAGVWAQILPKFGAIGTAVPGDEVYVMFERKAFDMMEWSGPAENITMGFHQAGKYLIIPGAHFSGGIFDFVIGQERWDGLPEKVRKQINTAAKLALFDSHILMMRDDIAAFEKMRASKRNEILQLERSTIEAVHKAGREWAMEKAKEQSGKGNQWMQKVADSYYGYLDNWNENAVYRSKAKH